MKDGREGVLGNQLAVRVYSRNCQLMIYTYIFL